jgi:hypothetical protein
MNAIRVFFMIISLLLVTLQSGGQNEKYRKPTETSGFLLSGPAGNSCLSVNPVTNREYITYLCWLYNVYRDYPEMFLKAFPGIGKSDLTSITGDQFDLPGDFLKLISSSDLNMKYIFNPSYIDYPVMGLSWSQCMNYLAWITDRYNERALIRNGELYDDPNQANENNFNFEAYISGQYEGMVRRLRPDKKSGGVRRTDWSDSFYFPAFRLPTEAEMNTLIPSLKTSVTAYKPNPFLASWTDFFITVKKDSVIILLDYNWPEKGRIALKSIEAGLSFKAPEAEYTFESVLKKNLSNIYEIYSALGQNILSGEEQAAARMVEKNKFGFMKFIITGEDKDSNPVLVPRIYYDQTRDAPVNTIFRYAVNAVR